MSEDDNNGYPQSDAIKKTRKRYVPANRFKKGESGNPAGRPALPPEIRELKKLAKDDLEKLISLLLDATDQRIEEILNSPETPMIEKIMAQVLKKSYETGSMGQFDMVLNRVIGKVKEHIEHTGLKPTVLVTTGGDVHTFTQAPTKELGEGEA